MDKKVILKKDWHWRLTPSKRLTWLKVYAKSKNISNACKTVGISHMAIWRLIKSESDPEFNKKKREIDDALNEIVESRLFEQTKNSPVAAFFWLCNRNKDKWQNVQKLEHTGKDGKKLGFIIVDADKIEKFKEANSINKSRIVKK